MDAALQRLTKRFPPPSNPRYADVDWTRLESAVGLTYPSSFKEFVATYGGSIWFDNVAPLYCTPKVEDPEAFL